MGAKLQLNGPEDEAYLRQFERVVKDLRQRSVLQRSQLLNWSWKSEQGKSARFRHHLHDADRITAFLADVRKFHMDKEPLQLPKLFTWLRQRVNDPLLVAQLDSLKKAYKARLRGSNVRIFHKGQELSPRDLLNTYLNGKYFHNDDEKTSLIDELEASDLVSRVVAMEAAVVIAKTALYVADIVKQAKEP